MLYNPTLNPALMAAYNAALASLAESQQQAGAQQETGAASSSGGPSSSQAQPGAGPLPEGAFMQAGPPGATLPLQMPQLMFNPYVMVSF